MYDTIPSENLPSVIAILGTGVFFLILYWLLITQKINNNFNRLNLSLIMSVLILTPGVIVTVPGGEDGMIPGLVSEDGFNAIVFTFGGYFSLILLFFNRPEWLRSDTESEAKDRGLNGKKDYLKNWEILELSMNGEHPSKILSGKRWVEYVEWKLNRGMIPGLDSKDCEVGTGGWGLGKCENQGIYQCPRCSKYCCNNHKSWVRTYQGEPVCEPCSRGMQHS